MEAYSEDDIKFKHPFSMMIAGPRRSGKTEFTRKLILNSETLIDEKIDRFVWFYSSTQDELVKSLSHKVEFRKKLPAHDLEDEFSEGTMERVFVVIDDLMEEANKRSDVKSLFTRGRHLNVSVLFLTQNLFHRGKNNRDISLNTDYMILFRNPRDVSIVNHIGKQMGDIVLMKEAYKKATENPFSFLVVDMRCDSIDRLRFRSNVFDEFQIVYEKV